MAHFDALWAEAREAFGQTRTWERARTLSLSALVCLGRHTITGMLTSAGQQFADWSASYRLFEEKRFCAEGLFAPLRRKVGELLTPGSPFFAALDDTLARKRGGKVAGAAWRRDPLGPPFQANLVWAQRFLQTTALLPETQGPSRARAIPIDWQHCPGAKRPGIRATPQQQAAYRVEAKLRSLPAQAVGRLTALRQDLDADPGGAHRLLVVAVDGAYTNRTVFGQIPERTVLIGRVRKDAALFAAPPPSFGRGRRRVYGDPLPTPEQVRQNETLPWQTVSAYAAGKVHSFELKVVSPVRWKGAGNRDLILIVIRPLAYRPTKGRRLLYRNPAYLLCSDPSQPLDKILQAYLWRWEVEVAFREEKTLLGLGEAQVRTERAVAQAPAFVAAAYGYLHLAATGAGLRHCPLPAPKWRHPKSQARGTTGELLGLLRGELWGRALGVNFEGFASRLPPHLIPSQFPNSPASAVIYAQR